MCETVCIDPPEAEHILLCWPISLHVAMPCLKHPEQNLGVRILTGGYSHNPHASLHGAWKRRWYAFGHSSTVHAFGVAWRMTFGAAWFLVGDFSQTRSQK